MPTDEPPTPPRLGLPVLLFSMSGLAGLTYEVLWQRELGLLFGTTAEATATTLVVFFLGLAAGSWAVGRRCVRWARPLRAFGWLELGVTATALLVLLVLPAYRSLFGPLYRAVGHEPGLMLLAKFLLSALLLAPCAVLMGGTLPVLAEWAVRRGGGFARAGILLYAVNTLGAVLGAALAGFVLPRQLGYGGAYAVAVGVSATVGALALLRPERAAPAPTPAGPGAARVRPALLALAGASGFVALALQVLWTRMTALVAMSSVYSFAGVLVAFLLALALGAFVARALARRAPRPARVLQVLLLLAGVAALASGPVFRWATGSPPAVGRGEDFAGYLAALGGVLALSVFPAAFCVGVVFPYLLRLEESRAAGDAGARLGRLAAANTLGALLGALAAGFLLPPLLGLWSSLAALAGIYALALPCVPGGDRRTGGALAVVLLAAAAAQAVTDPPRGNRWDLREGERVLAHYEGSAGSVRVVDRRGDLKLRLDNSYTLGGTSQPRWEHYQAHLPLTLHPDPKRVFFLGMGTGITAGAALHHDVEHVRVAEIVPEAVRGAREHFGPWLHGLFEDPRAEVVVEDARAVLVGSPDRYDVVVGDLFLPWRPGAALLYTQEHFQAVRARLTRDGLFAQWLPLYQLSEEAFRGIVATFRAVFGECLVWRGDFFSRRPIVALVGRRVPAPLDAQAFEAAWLRLQAKGAVDFGSAIASLPFMLYAGAVPAGDDPLAKGRVLTDRDPWIEFEAPIALRARTAGIAQAFVGKALHAWEAGLQARTPPESDPLLAGCSPRQRRYVEGGLAFHGLAVFAGSRDGARRREALDRYLRLVPRAVQPVMEDWVR